MKGFVGMNLRLNFLKLTILIMLVLVLIPAIAAENSTDSFYVEYDVCDEGVYTEEYQSVDNLEIDDTQVKSSDNEFDSADEIINKEIDRFSQINESVSYDDEHIFMVDLDSACETLDINTSDYKDSYVSDFTEIEDDVNESCEDGFTIDGTSINNSFHISYFNPNIITILSYLADEIGFFNSISVKNLDRETFNIWDSVNNIIHNSAIFDNGIYVIDVNDDFNDRHTGDFLYSIENSISEHIRCCCVLFVSSFFDTLFYDDLFFGFLGFCEFFKSNLTFDFFCNCLLIYNCNYILMK